MVGGPQRPVGGRCGVPRFERNPGQLPTGRNADINGGAFAGVTQFAALGTSPPPSPACHRFPFLHPPETGKGTAAHGFQLRGLDRGGGQVPRPRPPQQQHHAHRRRGVAQGDAEELVLRLVRAGRRRPRPRRRAQVRLRAGHPRRLLQVPPPPHPGTGPRPAPPAVADLLGQHRAGLVLPHRRGAVTLLSASLEINNMPPKNKIDLRGRAYTCH